MSMYRRDFLKVGAYAAASSTVMSSFMAKAVAAEPAFDLKMAGYPHEHIKGLMTGKVQVAGNSVQYEPGKIGDLNTHIISGPRELAFTEVGLTPYALAFANEGYRAYSLIPVFPLRTFRHKSIFVHADGGIDNPVQLKGKRVGAAGYSSTSLTWIRGVLQDEYGVRPEDIKWVVSAVDSSAGVSGKMSRQEAVLPEGLSVTTGPEGKDESDLLVDGDVDALFHAAEPRAFVARHPKVRRLFTDPRQVERDYYAKTRIFPMMHAVAIRNDLVEQHPWLPKAVFQAYSDSKALTYTDMRNKWFLRTLPWFAQELEATEDLMGENFAPYGVEVNRKAMDTLLRYLHEQKLASRRLKIEEIFEPSTLDLVEA